jgi:lambda family phage portal protein
MFNWLFRKRSEERGAELSPHVWDAARTDRRAAGWHAANTDFSHGVPPLLIRQRARQLVRDSPIAARAAQALADNVIGCGIKPLLKLARDNLKAEVLSAWNRWVDQADFEQRMDLYGLQALAAKQMITDGETIIRFYTAPDGRLELQVLPAEFLDSNVNNERTLAGVEFDQRGRPSGFWLFPTYPGNGVRLPTSIRVSASEVLHLFVPQQAGQVRGVSWLAPVLLSLRDLEDFNRATLVKQKVAALLTGFVTTPNDNPLGASQASDGAWGVSLEPGTLQKLSPGENIEFSQPPDVSSYSDYTKTILRSIAAGLGLPYSVLTGDLSDTSYSSARVGLLDFRRHIEALQWSFIFSFCRPVFQRWLELEVLRGALPLPQEGLDFYINAVTWTPPAMQMTDPQREVDATVRAIRAGLMSREQAISSLGWDREEIDAQIAAGNSAADQLGLVLDSDPRKVTQQGNPAQQTSS